MKTKPKNRSLIRFVLGGAIVMASFGSMFAQDPGPPLGIYEGRLPMYASFPDDSHLTNGYLCVKVSSRRALTGTVAFAGYIYRIPKGTVIAAEGTAGPVTLTHRTGPPAELRITSATDQELSGSVNRVGQAPIEFGGMSGHALRTLEKFTAKNPHPFAGLYTMCLDRYQASWEVGDPETNPDFFWDVYDDSDFPGHLGYGLMKISASGKATIRGQLPDGTKYASSTCARSYGADALDMWVYAPILKGLGSVAGPILSEWTEMIPGAPTLLMGGYEGGGWRWYVGNNPQPLNNRTWLEVGGAEYTPPAMGEPILGGGPLMTNVNQGTIPVFSPTGINATGLSGTLPGAPDPTAKPVAKYLATVEGATPPSPVTFQFNPKNGGYKATFLHPGTLKKTTAKGAVVQWQGTYELFEPYPGHFFEQLIGIEIGGHCGVFVNKIRQPDKSYISYPGWLHHDNPTPVGP